MDDGNLSAGGDKSIGITVLFNQSAVDLDDQHPEGVVHLGKQSCDSESGLPLDRVTVYSDSLHISPLMPSENGMLYILL